MKKVLFIALLIAALAIIGCQCKKEEAAVEDSLAVDTLAVDSIEVETTAPTEAVKPTTTKPPVKPTQPAENSLDKFLDDYEATVVMWEKKAAGPLTPEEIVEIGKKYSDMSKNAQSGDFSKKATLSQLSRMAQLNLRLSKVVKKVGASGRTGRF